MITKRNKQEQYKKLAKLSRTIEWIEGLLPTLLDKKNKYQNSKRKYTTEFETSRAEIERVTVLETVDDIIEQVEKANDKASNFYQED